MTDLELHDAQECEHVLCTCDGAVLLLVAGATVSSADEAPEAASADAPIPNMTCKPFPSSQKLLPPSQWNECVGTSGRAQLVLEP